MEVITMECAAFKKLTEQLTEIVQYARLAKMAFQENLTGKGLKPMLTNDDAAKMLGVSKRTLQRMRSDNRIDFIKIGNQCRYQVEAIERMVEERTLLDNQDLCLLFQISPRSLQRYRSLGVLPYKRLGQKTYYTEEDVMQFVENNVKEFKKENVEHYLTRIHQKFK